MQSKNHHPRQKAFRTGNDHMHIPTQLYFSVFTNCPFHFFIGIQQQQSLSEYWCLTLTHHYPFTMTKLTDYKRQIYGSFWSQAKIFCIYRTVEKTIIIPTTPIYTWVYIKINKPSDIHLHQGELIASRSSKQWLKKQWYKNSVGK